MNQANRKIIRRKQSGQSMVETLFAMPLLLAFGAALLQLYFIWEAKLTLNQATLMAARAGSVSSIDVIAMNDALAKSLIPLQAPDLNDPNSTPDIVYGAAFAQAQNLVLNNAVLRIANPTLEAFADFDPNAQNRIANDHLQARSTFRPVNSGINIQDANLLRIQVAYGVDLNIPFVGPIILAAVDAATAADAWYRAQTLDQGLYPIQAVATVRMQSDPLLTAANQAFFMTRQDVQDAI